MNKINEWSMASMNPMIPISKPFVLKVQNDQAGLINPKQYVLSPDIVADKYFVIDEDGCPKIEESTFMNNKDIIGIYEFIGDKSRLGKLYESLLNKDIVDQRYVYECLSNKKMLSEDQIDFDDQFVKVDLDLINHSFNSIKESFDLEIYKINGTDYSFKIQENYMNNNITLMEDSDGYYAYNELNGMRTESVKDMSDLNGALLKSITESISKLV